ncbi:protease SohB [Aurantivibrio plasticivorans]
MEYTADFLSSYGLFLAKTLTVLVSIAIIMILAFALGQKGHKPQKGHIEVTNLNDLYDDMSHTLKASVVTPEQEKLDAKAAKKKAKAEKAERKKQMKSQKAKASESDSTAETVDDTARKRVYVVNFDGDVKASATDNLREEITAILSLAREKDEVVMRLESGGGMVHSYGLAASQLQRITEKSIPLTVCVDKVAASGGYMMACVADKIIAAPFAIVGSIGVVGQLPNFNRLLKKNDIDFEMHTAGEYKRTLTVFAENTDKAREKFGQELEETHGLFKEYIRDNRPELDVEAVATGETWYGKRALDNKLIDLVQTSDAYLTGQVKDADIVEVQYLVKKSLQEKIGFAAQHAMDRLLLTWWERANQSRFFS